MQLIFLKVGKSYKNFFTEQPNYHSKYYAEVLQVNRYWLIEELSRSLDAITHEKLQSFIKNEYFPQVFIESLMMGNLTTQGF